MTILCLAPISLTSSTIVFLPDLWFSHTNFLPFPQTEAMHLPQDLCTSPSLSLYIIPLPLSGLLFMLLYQWELPFSFQMALASPTLSPGCHSWPPWSPSVLFSPAEIWPSEYLLVWLFTINTKTVPLSLFTILSSALRSGLTLNQHSVTICWIH